MSNKKYRIGPKAKCRYEMAIESIAGAFNELDKAKNSDISDDEFGECVYSAMGAIRERVFDALYSDK